MGRGEADERRDVRHPPAPEPGPRGLPRARRHGLPRGPGPLGQPGVLRPPARRRRLQGDVQRKPGRPGVCGLLRVQEGEQSGRVVIPEDGSTEASTSHAINNSFGCYF